MMAAGTGINTQELTGPTLPHSTVALNFCISVTCCWMNKGRLDGTTLRHLFGVQQRGTDLLQASFPLLRW